MRIIEGGSMRKHNWMDGNVTFRDKQRQIRDLANIMGVTPNLVTTTLAERFTQTVRHIRHEGIVCCGQLMHDGAVTAGKLNFTCQLCHRQEEVIVMDHFKV